LEKEGFRREGLEMPSKKLDIFILWGF
jgi:hypothetical protein